MSAWKALFRAVVGLVVVACGYLALRVVYPQRATFRGHTGRVTSVVASPDGKTLASGSEPDRTVKLWDVGTRREVASLPGGHAAFSPDGQTLAFTGYPHGKIHLWDVGKGRHRATLRGHTDSVYALAFTPDGQTLTSGGADKRIKLWDVAAAKERITLRLPDTVLSVAFSPDGQTLASGSGDRAIRLWGTASGKERATLRRAADARISGCGFVGCVAFSPDGKTLASGHWETVKLWDVATGRCTGTLDGRDDDDVQGMAFSPDGKTLATLDDFGTIRLWDVASGQITAAWRKDYHEPRPRLFRFIRSVLAGYPGVTDVFPGINDQYTVPLSVMYLPGGKLVALGYDGRDDKTVRMWPVAAVAGGSK